MMKVKKMSSISIEYQRLKSLFTNVDESKSELVDELEFKNRIVQIGQVILEININDWKIITW